MKTLSKSNKFFWLLMTLICIFSCFGFGQDDPKARCLVRGVVYDRCNQPVIGATVTAKYPDGRVFSALSVENGTYGPGTYAIGVYDYPEYADVWAYQNGWQSPVIRVYAPFPNEPVFQTFKSYHDVVNCTEDIDETVDAIQSQETGDDCKVSALLRGVIYDRCGNPLVGATINVQYPNGSVYTGVSAASGWYGSGSYYISKPSEPDPEYVLVWAVKGIWCSNFLKVCFPAPNPEDRTDLQNRYHNCPVLPKNEEQELN